MATALRSTPASRERCWQGLGVETDEMRSAHSRRHIIPQARVDLVERVREACERIGVVRHRSALGNARDDDLLAPLHRIEQAHFIILLLDPRAARAVFVSGEEVEFVRADLNGDRAVVLVLIARHDFRLAFGAPLRPVVDQEIDGIALDLGGQFRGRGRQRVANFPVARRRSKRRSRPEAAKQGRVIGLSGSQRARWLRRRQSRRQRSGDGTKRT